MGNGWTGRCFDEGEHRTLSCRGLACSTMTAASQTIEGATGGEQDHSAGPAFGVPESFEVVAGSPSEALAGITSVVCIPTFRRPDMLEATLRSLANQSGGHDFAVIVVE